MLAFLYGFCGAAMFFVALTCFTDAVCLYKGDWLHYCSRRAGITSEEAATHFKRIMDNAD
jgi:hypothetical protein